MSYTILLQTREQWTTPKKPNLSDGVSVKVAFLSNYPLVINLYEEEFSGVWLRAVGRIFLYTPTILLHVYEINEKINKCYKHTFVTIII